MDFSFEDLIFVPFIVMAFVLTPLMIMLVRRKAARRQDKAQEVGMMLGLQHQNFFDALQQYARSGNMSDLPDIELPEELGDQMSQEAVQTILKIPFVSKIIQSVSPWVLTGRYNGFNVSVHPSSRGSSSSNTRTTFVRYRVRFDTPVSTKLSVSNEDFLSRSAKKIGGMVDISLGNPEIDNELFIKGENEPQIVSFLSDVRRVEALRELVKSSPPGELDQGGVTIEDYQGGIDLEKVRQRLRSPYSSC